MHLMRTLGTEVLRVAHTPNLALARADTDDGPIVFVPGREFLLVEWFVGGRLGSLLLFLGVRGGGGGLVALLATRDEVGKGGPGAAEYGDLGGGFLLSFAFAFL